jgi:signal transduction histidine kinase
VPFFVGLGLLLVLGAFAALSFRAVDESRQRALQERLQTAQLVARHVDLSIEQSLALLRQTAALPEIDLTDADTAPERQALARTRDQLGIFSYSLFLLDAQGDVVASLPEGRPIALRGHEVGQAQIESTLTTASPCVSGLQCARAAGQPVVCLTVPVFDRGGRVVGLLGGSLDLASPSIGGFISGLQLGQTGYAQVVDKDGLVLTESSQTEPSGVSAHSPHFATLIAENRSVVTPCHSCHEVAGLREVRRDVIAFAPLSAAPWGIAISQAESEAFAPAFHLQQQALLLSSFSFVFAIMLAWFGVRGVVRPVGTLTRAAERIAGGDLSAAVAVEGKDEIGRLARAFETMRQQLRASLDHIQGWNRELEAAVARRTGELEESRQAIGRLYTELQQKERARSHLLQKVISAQEEERRRIARELHDETSQALTALALGLEAAANDPRAGDPQALKGRVVALKPLVINTLDEVHNLIFDLRPACLDDLGLVAALQWYADKRLVGLGIAHAIAVEGEERRLPGEVEAALFRIVQEALTNVIKHAEADSVRLNLAFAQRSLTLVVADDGRGFDASRALSHHDGERGYGLLGMHERVELLSGTLEVVSRPGEGTRLSISVPLADPGVASV